MSDTSGPQFDEPPVSQVALALYFDSPLPLRNVDIGMLGARWQDRYPSSIDQAPLPPVPVEQFEAAPSSVLSIQFTGTYPGSRTWFQSPAGDRVVQIQADRLVLNWLRTTTAPRYPSYDALRPEFLGVVEELNAFTVEQDRGPIKAGQVEVTYTNIIPAEVVEGGRAIERLISPWSGIHSDTFLPRPESVSINASYVIPSDGTGLGRLYVQGQRAFGSQMVGASPETVYLLQVFARCPAKEGDVAEVAMLLDLAHHWVVNGFTSVTTPEMHTAWGRTEQS